MVAVEEESLGAKDMTLGLPLSLRPPWVLQVPWGPPSQRTPFPRKATCLRVVGGSLHHPKHFFATFFKCHLLLLHLLVAYENFLEGPDELSSKTGFYF